MVNAANIGKIFDKNNPSWHPKYDIPSWHLNYKRTINIDSNTNLRHKRSIIPDTNKLLGPPGLQLFITPNVNDDTPYLLEGPEFYSRNNIFSADGSTDTSGDVDDESGTKYSNCY